MNVKMIILIYANKNKRQYWILVNIVGIVNIDNGNDNIKDRSLDTKRINTGKNNATYVHCNNLHRDKFLVWFIMH